MQERAITTVSLKELPDSIKKLSKPPEQLRARGDANLLYSGPKVGIVGARKFTPYGKEVTSQIASSLARAGVTVVSGLALGVDSIAHKACIHAGGRTIAVLPSGLKNVYPASHSGLADQILKTGGLLVSEYPDTFRPFKVSFLERNRIIAALSDILVITEAAKASGSLNTASSALEMGITVMAVPGNINSPYSEGTNRLIASGAEPVLSAQDILNNLNLDNTNVNIDYLPENEHEKLILQAIKSGYLSTNDIISIIGLDISQAQTTLSLLEIKGVLSVSGGRWSLD